MPNQQTTIPNKTPMPETNQALVGNGVLLNTPYLTTAEAAEYICKLPVGSIAVFTKYLQTAYWEQSLHFKQCRHQERNNERNNTMNKIDAKQYLEHRINTEKGFATKMLVDLIIKSCDQTKLEAEVERWKSNATTTPAKPATPPSKPTTPTPTPGTNPPTNKPSPKPPTKAGEIGWEETN